MTAAISDYRLCRHFLPLLTRTIALLTHMMCGGNLKCAEDLCVSGRITLTTST